MTFLHFEEIYNHPIAIKSAIGDVISLNVVRLDKVHQIVSGNKWFKLKYYLEEALQNKYSTIATWGGAYSNHIVATAYAAKELNLESIGIIRGEQPQFPSHTLQQAKEAGMQLHFVSRTDFNNKSFIQQKYPAENCLWIDEGGYGTLGAKGAATIAEFIPSNTTHIICAVGTGTMMAGLIQSAQPNQQVIGVSVLKNNLSIENEIKALLPTKDLQKKFLVLHDYHFGGYAKHPPALIDFMNELYHRYQLPTDIVYTSKMMYGLLDLIRKDHFPPDAVITAIHSGGLQGNGSLSQGILSF
ncbi:MAG: pyridoxal-phosphate dependent enzyme [Bacteroidota bacterium]|nr:pyridoxal-phosphate dependent enzyme [Bacteroidota bacterium]